ncbi:MAG: hypothetical protein Q9221_004714 [Calogaya cf. arnoldii]
MHPNILVTHTILSLTALTHAIPVPVPDKLHLSAVPPVSVYKREAGPNKIHLSAVPPVSVYKREADPDKIHLSTIPPVSVYKRQADVAASVTPLYKRKPEADTSVVDVF